MTSALCLLSIFAALYTNIENTDAQVAILTDDQPCVCGRSFNLTCKVTNYTRLAWIEEGEVIPIVKCRDAYCRTNRAYSEKYNFTYNMKEQCLTLTIIKVTMADSGKTLMCSDGDHLDSWKLTVREYEPMLIEDTEKGIITVNSGCSSYENNDVTFIWKKVDSNGNESEFDPAREKNERKCSNSCGKELKLQKQYSEKIKAETTANGGYYLKSEVVYEDEHIKSVKSSKKYQFDEKDGDVNTLIVLVSIISVVAVVVLGIILRLLYMKRKKSHRSYRPTSMPI